MTTESRRQKKVASVIQKDFSEILQRHGSNYYGKAFVTITGVRVTPDLGVARIYLSIFNSEEPQTVVNQLKQNVNELRRHLGNMIKNQVRRIPELEFYLDSTLDSVFRIEEIFRNMKEEEEGRDEKS